MSWGWATANAMEAILQSVITCPQCGAMKEETMPTDACQFFYECMPVTQYCARNRVIAACSVPTERLRVRQSS